MPRPIFDQCFKFAFVRNPWDWAVSYYHFIRDEATHHRHQRISKLGGFADFVELEMERGKYGQKQFVTDPAGHLLVDYVGRFETLGSDFGHICQRLKLTARLCHVNRSSHHDYRYYYNSKTIELVAQWLADDINFFDYTFDGIRGRMAA